jgi:alkaline phosphatase D
LDALGALLFTFPSKSKFLNIANVVINTLLLLLAVDFTYTPAFKIYDPTFTRVGAVDHDSAKVVVRYPGLEEGQLRVVWQRVHSVLGHTDVWKGIGVIKRVRIAS